MNYFVVLFIWINVNIYYNNYYKKIFVSFIPKYFQMECHPYLVQTQLVSHCWSRGLAVTAYSPLGSPDRPWVTPGEAHLLDDPRVVGLAKRYNKTPAQVIIRWGWSADPRIGPHSLMSRDSSFPLSTFTSLKFKNMSITYFWICFLLIDGTYREVSFASPKASLRPGSSRTLR